MKTSPIRSVVNVGGPLTWSGLYGGSAIAAKTAIASSTESDDPGHTSSSYSPFGARRTRLELHGERERELLALLSQVVSWGCVSKDAIGLRTSARCE